MFKYKTVLIVAGMDPSGGAGVAADIKTCTANGVYAMCAVTALTAQNTVGVRGVLDTTSFLGSQLEAVLDDIRPDAVKIGMLPSVRSVEIVADVIKRYGLRNIVVDPVMVATSGDVLSPESAAMAMCEQLVPLADVVTPNIPEAEHMIGRRIMSDSDIAHAAHRIIEMYNPGSVLVKGGHMEHPHVVTDYLYTRSGVRTEHRHERIMTRNTHGTGCTLSSAIAANLAQGFDVAHSVQRAETWLGKALAAGVNYSLGKGSGPVNHLFGILK